MEKAVASQDEIYRAEQEKFNRAVVNTVGDRNMVNVRVVDYAEVPVQPRFSRLFLIFVAIIGGALLSIANAMLREYFDDSIESPEDAEAAIGVPVLGSIERYWLWGWSKSEKNEALVGLHRVSQLMRGMRIRWRLGM